MRLWVRPDQLAKLGITVPEIVTAIQSQNTVNPVGRVGGEPIPPGQQFAYAVRAQGRLVSPEEFGEIVVRESQQGGVVRVKDVARVELGAQDYSVAGRLNGKPSAIVAVYQLPGSNAVDAAAGEKLMEEMKGRFPSDMDYTLSLDSTRSVVEGMKEIIITLLIAIGLVIMVVYVFLQGWRATLIPLLAVPVSLVGTFVFFPLFGFSINTLSLFGLVLAIGLVVDDAIVVVEAVERHIEDGMTPKDAALKAMEEISGPVIGIALVLSAVFVPTAFIPGITGRLYQQFAVTIAISVLLSAFNALSLSPALAALLLRPQKSQQGPAKKILRPVQSDVRTYHQRLRPGLCGPHSQERRGDHAPRVRRWRLVLRQQNSIELSSGRGPGIPLHQLAATERGLHRAHRPCDQKDRGHPGPHPGSGDHHQRRRIQFAQLYAIHIQRIHLGHLEAVGRTNRPGPSFK